MLPSLPAYERLIYTLPDRYPSIRQSTLVVIRRGPAFAELTGVVEFEGEITLEVMGRPELCSRRHSRLQLRRESARRATILV